MTGRSLLPTRATTAATAVVVAFGAFVLGGCGGSGGSGYAAAKDQILVVGDSIMAQSSQEVSGALRAAGWKPTVSAGSGATIHGGLKPPDSWPKTVAPLVRKLRPAVVVVELGTNDTSPQICCKEVRSSIDDLMDTLRDVPHVLWLNVQEGRLNSRNAERVNHDLQAATKQWSNLRIVDFSRRFTGRPQWHLGSGPHLNDAGQVAFAQMIQHATSEWAPGRS